MKGNWNEFDADVLGKEIGRQVADMLRDRELRIEQLERELAMAELRIEQLRERPK